MFIYSANRFPWNFMDIFNVLNKLGFFPVIISNFNYFTCIAKKVFNLQNLRDIEI